VIEHGPDKRPVLEDLIPCLYFSESFKIFKNLGGVKLKHLYEIQNTSASCAANHRGLFPLVH